MVQNNDDMSFCEVYYWHDKYNVISEVCSSFTSSAIYGVATTPNDFATYLLAILVVNGLLYLAFYVIMKVLVLKVVLSMLASVIITFLCKSR